MRFLSDYARTGYGSERGAQAVAEVGANAAGDYWGLDVYGVGRDQVVMAAWNTTVNGNQDIYVSR